MKEIIKSVLDKHKDNQINLGSEAAREQLASEIEASEREVLAIAYNGQLSKRMFDIASDAKVPTIIGTSIKSGEEPNSELEAWATSDWA